MTGLQYGCHAEPREASSLATTRVTWAQILRFAQNE